MGASSGGSATPLSSAVALRVPPLIALGASRALERARGRPGRLRRVLLGGGAPVVGDSRRALLGLPGDGLESLGRGLGSGGSSALCGRLDLRARGRLVLRRAAAGEHGDEREQRAAISARRRVDMDGSMEMIAHADALHASCIGRRARGLSGILGPMATWNDVHHRRPGARHARPRALRGPQAPDDRDAAQGRRAAHQRHRMPLHRGRPVVRLDAERGQGAATSSAIRASRCTPAPATPPTGTATPRSPAASRRSPSRAGARRSSPPWASRTRASRTSSGPS